jgi:hypothetical protein
VQVKILYRAYDLSRIRDRTECFAASVALYRLFVALLRHAPYISQRAALFFPEARPHDTFITHVFASDRGSGSVVRKEIFQPDSFFATFGHSIDDVSVRVLALDC